jgi:excisionase family DNA binding protein
MISASIPRCAELTDLPAHHIRAAVKDGSLPARKFGTRKVIMLDDLREWLRAHSSPTTKQTVGVSS